MLYVSSSLRILSLVFAVSFLASCGKRPQIVSNVQVTSQVQDQDVKIQVSADLKLNNMSLPSLSVPVYHPRQGYEIGSVTLQSPNRVQLQINASELIPLQQGNGQLPNGLPLPMAGKGEVAQIAIGRHGIEIYSSLGQTAAMIGVAVPIKSFDGIGRTVGTTMLFPGFNIKGIEGVAGIFTSRSAGSNGMGLFIDLKSILSRPEVQEALVARYGRLANQIQVREKMPSARTEDRIGYELYKLNKKKIRLQVR